MENGQEMWIEVLNTVASLLKCRSMLSLTMVFDLSSMLPCNLSLSIYEQKEKLAVSIVIVGARKLKFFISVASIIRLLLVERVVCVFK